MPTATASKVGNVQASPSVVRYQPSPKVWQAGLALLLGSYEVESAEKAFDRREPRP
jgi:hypothetical protein